MDTKICTKCDQEKSVEDFPKCNRNKNGRRAECKQCRSVRDSRRPPRKRKTISQPPAPIIPIDRAKGEQLIEAEVRRRVIAELKKQRSASLPLEQRIQLRAYHKLADNHPQEYARLLKRERIALMIQESPPDIFGSQSD